MRLPVCVSQIPQAMPLLLCSAMMNGSPPLHIVLVGARDSDETRAMLQRFTTIFRRSKP
jgi:hypothetical protein